MMILITGGARSGKSRFAQQTALKLSKNPVYVATAKIWDADFQKRVERHQSERGPEWTAYEAEKDLWKLPLQDQVVVIDCVTLWLTNYFVLFKQDIDLCLKAFREEINLLKEKQATYLIVTNEIGMGLHPDSEIGRKFADLQGWANQFIAAEAEEVVLMVAGIPLYVKKPTIP